MRFACLGDRADSGRDGDCFGCDVADRAISYCWCAAGYCVDDAGVDGGGCGFLGSGGGLRTFLRGGF